MEGETRTTVQESRAKIAGYGLLSGLFVVGSLFMVTHPDKPSTVWVGWLSIAFFGLGLVVFIWLLIRPQTLTLDAEGFTLEGGMNRNPRRVLWGDVDHFFLYVLPRGGKMPAYNYKAGRRPSGKASAISHALGADGSLPRGWTLSPKELVELLNTYRERAGS